MSKSINRRNFLKSSAALALVAGESTIVGAQNMKSKKKQEYYEWRAYRTKDAKKMALVHKYLESALIPAMGRMGIDRIGVFTNMNEPTDYSVYLLIPYPTLDQFSNVNETLLKDEVYYRASKSHFAALKDDPVFSRIESKFHKAFAGMPVIEMPEQTAGKNPRIFELRVYESHTEEKAALKVDMFNSGEIQIMRDVEMAPVFFGEALIGDDLPNLMYMLSAANMKAHEEHWSKFGAHPEWERMREMKKYEDTVSHITSTYLIPTGYSQI